MTNVIYSCTYEDDNAWAKLMRKLRKEMLEQFELDDPYLCQDMLMGLEWTVRHDRKPFERVSKD